MWNYVCIEPFHFGTNRPQQQYCQRKNNSPVFFQNKFLPSKPTLISNIKASQKEGCMVYCHKGRILRHMDKAMSYSLFESEYSFSQGHILFTQITEESSPELWNINFVNILSMFARIVNCFIIVEYSNTTTFLMDAKKYK